MMYLVALGFLGMAMGQNFNVIDCTTEQEGAIFWGCRAYHRCNRGQTEFVECDPGEVFDEAVGGCNRREQVRTPCARDFSDACQDVSGVYPQSFAVTDYTEDGRGGSGLRCTYFYVCYREIFWGTQKCTGGTIFNDSTQRCEDPTSVPGDCGFQRDNSGN